MSTTTDARALRRETWGARPSTALWHLVESTPDLTAEPLCGVKHSNPHPLHSTPYDEPRDDGAIFRGAYRICRACKHEAAQR